MNPVELVVKVGGGLLAHQAAFDSTLAAIAEAATRCALVVVPGGGPFADAVRDVDRRVGLSDDAAHWMAVLAMDQYAYLLASRLAAGLVVTGPDEALAAVAAGRVPVLAPSSWLRRVDPLPHSWDVTSDSIAAWVAGQLGARRLVLIKPPGASGDGLVDAHFIAALAPGLHALVIPADQPSRVAAALRARPHGA